MNGIMEARTTTLAPPPAHPRHVPSDTDCDAFVREVYDRYGPPLVRYATRLLDGDWHKAEDILQETATRAWKHGRFRCNRGDHIRPWLFTVARNLVIDHHRARRNRPLELMPVEDLDASWDSTESTITTHAVRKALRELNEQQRTVIRLMYHLECSVAQTAEHLGVPPGTVKSRAFYAVRALRKALEKQGVLAAPRRDRPMRTEEAA
ncbi:sigma-70 family RNA polymerase sigma factor [Streptomyces sp. SP18BB07]|uniref:sigma-70 family RNA polymerase sigma factor n=2 Tax=unclassified Streptomyces TaxID=2593676 RepID=UPI002E7897E4|nr:sigma-70 family RNA polymerase sigma factor [Streptomyces sp. SP18BB07]MEE1763971.1 sigma-70 family RNA polymerase sigma factor [Streptomyces sp. SP18BB07]